MLKSLVATAALCASVVAHAGEEPFDLGVSLAVAVSVDGHVTAITPHGRPLPDAIQPLERQVGSWEFEPARVDGRAVPSLTHVALTLHGEPLDATGEQIGFTITRASNGPAIAERTLGHLPIATYSAAMTFDVDIAADGTVRKVSLLEFRADRASIKERLVKSASDALARWRFVPEQVDGEPIAAHVTVPLSFCVAKGRCTPPPDAPATPADNGTLIADAPVIRLKTEVVGRTL